jgi:hypothetical protein
VELQGTIQNGMVILDNPLPLADGTKVKIWMELPAEPPRQPTLRERLLKLAGTVDDLPADMARNHDHYIHGTPKR